MKFTAQNIAFVVTALSSSVSGLIKMEVRYSDNMINVGSLNAFHATWEVAYGTAGSLQGVVTDDTYQTDTNVCQTDDKSDLTVRVTMDGAWGVAGKATAANMRDALIQTAWKSVEAIWDEHKYQVYEGCEGLTWQEGPKYTPTAACGPKSPTGCEAACPDAGTPTLVQCPTSAWASMLPSTLKVTCYNDGMLLADDITVTFAASSNDISDGGCGIVGIIAEKLAGYIPVVGGLFAEGIAYECEK